MLLEHFRCLFLCCSLKNDSKDMHIWLWNRMRRLIEFAADQFFNIILAHSIIIYSIEYSSQCDAMPPEPASQPARRRRSRTDKISPQRIHCAIRMHSCGFVQLSSCNSVWKATIVMKIMTYDLFAGLQWYLYFCTCYAVLSLCFWSTTTPPRPRLGSC